eukprot:jgi/Botrbrau1/9024/Bobra.0376s0002.1
MALKNSRRTIRWICGVFIVGLLGISLLTLALSQRPLDRPNSSLMEVNCNTTFEKTCNSAQIAPEFVDEADCEEPVVNLAWLKSLSSLQAGAHTCEGFERVCVDQGVLIMHDYKYSPVNPVAADLPSFQVTDLLTAWVGPEGNIGDVYEKGRMTYPPLIFRLPMSGDQTPSRFSRCTLPLLLFKSFESNYHEVLMAVLGQVFHWYHEAAVDSRVTYVVNSVLASCGYRYHKWYRYKLVIGQAATNDGMCKRGTRQRVQGDAALRRILALQLS